LSQPHSEQFRAGDNFVNVNTKGDFGSCEIDVRSKRTILGLIALLPAILVFGLSAWFPLELGCAGGRRRGAKVASSVILVSLSFSQWSPSLETLPAEQDPTCRRRSVHS
jgi:hypothetical protein